MKIPGFYPKHVSASVESEGVHIFTGPQAILTTLWETMTYIVRNLMEKPYVNCFDSDKPTENKYVYGMCKWGNSDNRKKFVISMGLLGPMFIDRMELSQTGNKLLA